MASSISLKFYTKRKQKVRNLKKNNKKTISLINKDSK